MKSTVRFGVSIEEALIKKFDKFIKERNYKNRSEAIRDLMREILVKEEWEKTKIITGGIAIVYDHHKKLLVNKIIDIQHEFHDLIISSQHIHLDYNNCFEVIIVKGLSIKARKLFNQLKSTKGVKHIDILKSTTGKEVI